MKPMTPWQLRVKTGKIRLPQLDHLEQCIESCGTTVSLVEPFDLWQKYENSQQGAMRLYAHQTWRHIDEIVDLINNQTSDWVYAAINRYLLTCEPDANADPDYDQAIKNYFDQRLTKYKVIDYQYQHNNHTGNVGNFVSPDNRLLCQKL